MTDINETHVIIKVLTQGKKLFELSGFVLDEDMDRVELHNLLFKMEQELNGSWKYRFHIETKEDNTETRLAIKEYGE